MRQEAWHLRIILRRQHNMNTHQDSDKQSDRKFLSNNFTALEYLKEFCCCLTSDCNKNNCYTIGTFSKKEVIKRYCCECYSKIDSDFTSDKWCDWCKKRLLENESLLKRIEEAKDKLNQKRNIRRKKA